MKDDIKEILDRLFVYRNENDEMNYQPEDILTIDDVWLLLDYITNLQEENENLKDFNNKLQATKDRLDKYDRENQLKIDEAVEFIAKEFLCYDNESDEYIQGKKAINILKGEDNE